MFFFCLKISFLTFSKNGSKQFISLGQTKIYDLFKLTNGIKSIQIY